MSAWSDFVTASLLGTDKGGALPATPAALQEVLGPAAGLGREAQFLTHAGALALWRRAGWKPAQGETALPSVAPPETSGSMVNVASVAHLRAMLSGHCVEVLPEWLGVVTEKHRRLPPEWLPGLLDRARQSRALRPLVMAAGGARVRWLAGLNPDWNFAADDAPEHWETGGREQRLAILRGWRASQPAEAREKLEAVWSGEPADTRAAFLGALADGLSEEDSPFLERALDDRGKDVRRLAATLLARLPNSPFVARMVARSIPLLDFHKGGLLTRSSLSVTLPDEPDAAARRDGLDPKELEIPQTMGGEKAGLLAHILAAVPLRRWTEAFQQTPESLLKAAERHDFAAAIVSGWALAAVRQRDRAWAGALLDGGKGRLERVHLVRTLELFDVLPPAERMDRLLAAMLAEPFQATSANPVSWHGLLTHFSATREYLPEAMAARLLADLRRVAVTDATLPVYYLRHFADALAIKVPSGLLPEAIQNWPGDKDWVARLVELLTFRHSAHAALAQP